MGEFEKDQGGKPGFEKEQQQGDYSKGKPGADEQQQGGGKDDGGKPGYDKGGEQ